MPPFRSDEEDEDTTFDEVSSMADRLGLQGEKRAAYIHDHMQGLGYEAVQSRESYRRPQKPEDQQDGGGGGFGKRWGFGSGGGQGAPAGGRPRQEDDSF